MDIVGGRSCCLGKQERISLHHRSFDLGPSPEIDRPSQMLIKITSGRTSKVKPAADHSRFGFSEYPDLNTGGRDLGALP